MGDPKRMFCDKCNTTHNLGQHTIPADCGAPWDHDPHLFLTPKLRAKACDGAINKR